MYGKETMSKAFDWHHRIKAGHKSLAYIITDKDNVIQLQETACLPSSHSK
jgi:hypothetical protein